MFQGIYFIGNYKHFKYLNWSCEGILPTVRRSSDEFLECVLFTDTSVLDAVEFLQEQLLPFLPLLPFGKAVFTKTSDRPIKNRLRYVNKFIEQ